MPRSPAHSSGNKVPVAVRGFTLLELLIALTLLALMLLGFYASFLAVQQHMQDGIHRARAASIAMELMNRIRSTGRNTAARAVYLQSNMSAFPVLSVPDFACHNTMYPCAPAEIAAADMQEIYYRFLTSLPQPDMQLEACDRSLCLVISWRDTDLEQCAAHADQCLYPAN